MPSNTLGKRMSFVLYFLAFHIAVFNCSINFTLKLLYSNTLKAYKLRGDDDNLPELFCKLEGGVLGVGGGRGSKNECKIIPGNTLGKRTRFVLAD